MRRAFLIVILGVVAMTTVGCADKRVTLSYQPSSNLAPIGEPQPLTIRGFNDRRGDESDGDPTRVGGIYGGYGNRLSKVMADSPLMLTFLNALADGFKARGVPVTVVVAPLAPGSAPPQGTVLTGDLKNFSTEARFTNSAHISAIIRLYGPAGALLVEKEVSERVRSDQSGGAGVFTHVGDLQRIMNEALAKFVDRVVGDPEIASRVGRAP